MATVPALFSCTWDVTQLELPNDGYQFFNFFLENNVEIIVKMTRHDGARVYAIPNTSPRSLEGVFIGKLGEKGIDFLPDDNHDWGT